LKPAKAIGIISAIWALSFVAPPAWAGQGAEIHSGTQSVALVARMPETASVAGLITPVPQELLEDGQSAETVLLQQSWTFAPGQTLSAECEVATGPQATAEIFTSGSQNLINGFVSAVPSVGAGETRSFPLVSGFDPAKGTVTDTQMLLIAHDSPGEDLSASVRVTVVAF
jgi:hypothetical protein